MEVLASQMAVLGKRSGNPIFRDFAELSAQYRFAYAKATATYIAADNWLAKASFKMSTLVKAACQAVGS